MSSSSSSSIGKLSSSSSSSIGTFDEFAKEIGRPFRSIGFSFILKILIVEGLIEHKFDLKRDVDDTYHQTVADLEAEQKKLANTRKVTIKPELDLQFEHTEDDILKNLADNYYILRGIDNMYGKTLTELLHENIGKWKKTLKDLIEKLKQTNNQYCDE